MSQFTWIVGNLITLGGITALTSLYVWYFYLELINEVNQQVMKDNVKGNDEIFEK